VRKREGEREKEGERERKMEREGIRESEREKVGWRERDVEYGCYIFIFKRKYRRLGTFKLSSIQYRNKLECSSLLP